jgi:hypothetical protein
MSPWLWIKTNGLVYEYIQAHREIPNVTKRRIHAFNRAHLKRDAVAYRALIQLHKEIGIDLHFIEEGLVQQTGIHRGFVIVDDQMLFSADDLHAFDNRVSLHEFTLDDLENAQFIGESGSFDFRDEEVSRHKEQFRGLRSKSESVLLTAEVFESNYLPHPEISDMTKL